MNYGLGFIGASLPTTLSINSTTQVVGSQPVYRIANATPGAQVYWSSEKDGASTGETRAAYGSVISANGSLEIAGGNWRAEDVGRWRKEIEIPNPDGTVSTASVYFNVVPEATAPAPVINTGASFFQTPLTYVGDFAITPVTIGLVVGGVWLAKQLRLIK